jgi:formylglycine-generating enzyme required for sulfatase activity
VEHYQGVEIFQWPGHSLCAAVRRNLRRNKQRTFLACDTFWREHEGNAMKGFPRPVLITLLLAALLEAPLVRANDAALKPGATFRDCAADCPEMIVLPAGDFVMGSPEGVGSKQERPSHKVTIANPFTVSKFEVTFAEWDACVAGGGCSHRPDDRNWGRGRQPVINVSWQDAKQYTAWLAHMTGLPYRLLSEAEWEYAARAGTTSRFSFGDEETSLSDYGWSTYNSELKAHPVGEKKPNAFGLYDIHGNASEWVEDAWHDSYVGAPSDGAAWVEGGDSSRRVVRGGSWHTKSDLLTSTFRWGSFAESRSYLTGFRIARTLKQ